MVCEIVMNILREKGHEVEMLLAKLIEPVDLGEYDLLILASPTHGHGVLEAYFEKFLDKMEAMDLKGKKVAVIGLGDPKYDTDYHLEAARIIMLFLQKKEAVPVGMPCRVTRQPLLLMENYIKPWAEKLAEQI